MSDDFGQMINTAIWQEIPESDNPFAAAVCRCRGYDVYGDVLGQAAYLDFLWLMFQGERPSHAASTALELLALGLANPGPRDPSVHAGMAAGASGTPAAAALMAALAAGAGSSGGAREVRLAMQTWQECGTDLRAWSDRLAAPLPNHPKCWPDASHPPGFGPHGGTAPRPVRQLLDALCEVLPDGRLAWLRAQRAELETVARLPLNMLGVAAAALTDLDCDPAAGEMLTLLWRLPGAAAHALEQQRRGFRQFPFFELELETDPGPAPQTVEATA
ncbi:MAG TPA: citryl-CoA lyase [Telluria sp.]|nr:citryl-CoA lyase [Telluria sp.]